MNLLEELYQKAHDADIDVFYLNLGCNTKAMCGTRDGLRGIALNRGNIESAAEERVVLAEEITHFETGLLYKVTTNCNTHQERVRFRKLEAKVKNATVKKILPAIDIIECACKGISSRYEMAEELSVTEEFLDYAIKYYKQKGVELNLA